MTSTYILNGFLLLISIAVFLKDYIGESNRTKRNLGIILLISGVAVIIINIFIEIDKSKDLKLETERRKRIESDFRLYIDSTSKSTRDSVVADIKKSPIKVQLSNDYELLSKLKRKEIRNALADYYTKGQIIQNRCNSDKEDITLRIDYLEWNAQIDQYLLKNLDKACVTQFNNLEDMNLEDNNRIFLDTLVQPIDKSAFWFIIDKKLKNLDKFLSQSY